MWWCNGSAMVAQRAAHRGSSGVDPPHAWHSRSEALSLAGVRLAAGGEAVQHDDRPSRLLCHFKDNGLWKVLHPPLKMCMHACTHALKQIECSQEQLVLRNSLGMHLRGTHMYSCTLL